MLKKFTLKNYKNFKDEISINFENTAGYQFSTDCITDGIISKMGQRKYGQYQIPESQYKEYFERLDLTEILKAQNSVSRDSITGFMRD